MRVAFVPRSAEIKPFVLEICSFIPFSPPSVERLEGLHTHTNTERPLALAESEIRPTESQTRQTDRKTIRQTDRQTDKQTDKQTRQTE
jgi:hypothetical protein